MNLNPMQVGPMRRTSLFFLTLGLTLGPAAFAQDTWTNDDPLCAPEIHSRTVAAVQKQQEMPQRDAEATDDFNKQIKNAPSADGKLLSCVDVAWPEVSLGGVAGIEQLIKSVGDKAVDQACKEMRKKVRDATSNFATPNLTSSILGSVTSGNYSGITDAATKAATDAATNAAKSGINSAVSNAGLPSTVSGADTSGAFGGLIDLIKPGSKAVPPGPAK